MAPLNKKLMFTVKGKNLTLGLGVTWWEKRFTDTLNKLMRYITEI